MEKSNRKCQNSFPSSGFSKENENILSKNGKTIFFGPIFRDKLGKNILEQFSNRIREKILIFQTIDKYGDSCNFMLCETPKLIETN